MVGDITSDVPWGKTRKTPAHLCKPELGKQLFFLSNCIALYQIVFQVLQRIEFVRCRKEGHIVWYIINILNKRYGLHRAGEIIFFVSLKLNSANGLSKYGSVNHVTTRASGNEKKRL